MKIDVQELAHIITTSRYQFLGVTAFPLNPPVDPPCSLITEPNLNSFQNALMSAMEYWPKNLLFAVIGGHALIPPMPGAPEPDYPRTFQCLQAPEVLLEFQGIGP